jgi:hypothetical protein
MMQANRSVHQDTATVPRVKRSPQTHRLAHVADGKA